jgi:hypothetical protein
VVVFKEDVLTFFAIAFWCVAVYSIETENTAPARAGWQIFAVKSEPQEKKGAAHARPRLDRP